MLMLLKMYITIGHIEMIIHCHQMIIIAILALVGVCWADGLKRNDLYQAESNQLQRSYGGYGGIGGAYGG